MSKPTLSRRAFLRLALLGGIGAGVAVLEKITQPVGAIHFTQWLLRGKYQQYLGPQQIVALGECPGYEADVLGSVREVWGLSGIPSVRGKKVLVKPNLVDLVGDQPSTTAPQVVAAVCDVLQEQGAAHITVGDGPAFRRDAVSVAQQVGLLRALTSRDIPFVDLNYDNPVPVKVRDGWFQDRQYLWLPRSAVEADLIVSAPKLKTHHWADISVSLKNLLGLLPGARYGWPKNSIHIHGIPPTILGLYRLLPPVVAVVDGIVGMQGDGPLFGTPVSHGLLAAGSDLLAVDSICAQLMGYDPAKISYLAMGAFAGLGQMERILVTGVPMEGLKRQYQAPPAIT